MVPEWALEKFIIIHTTTTPNTEPMRHTLPWYHQPLGVYHFDPVFPVERLESAQGPPAQMLHYGSLGRASQGGDPACTGYEEPVTQSELCCS